MSGCRACVRARVRVLCCAVSRISLTRDGLERRDVLGSQPLPRPIPIHSHVFATRPILLELIHTVGTRRRAEFRKQCRPHGPPSLLGLVDEVEDGRHAGDERVPPKRCRVDSLTAQNGDVPEGGVVGRWGGGVVGW